MKIRAKTDLRLFSLTEHFWVENALTGLFILRSALQWPLRDLKSVLGYQVLSMLQP